MKKPVRLFRPGYLAAALAAVCMVVFACSREERSPGEASGHDEGHAGHVVPAHKPKTFPGAVQRLRELNAQISRIVAEKHSGSLPDEAALNVALDIAHWLPEIAADSDMPEPFWNDVNARAVTIVADYRAIRSGVVAGEAHNRLENASRAISDLETLLAAADPRWFEGDERGGGAPPSEAHGAEGQ